MIKPDYAGGCIVNLMSSLLHARGATSIDLPEARLLPAAELADYRHLVLIVIDGLGANWLARHSPDGLLARHQLGSLTSVFPSTTAAAIGSFLTGVPPAQHGITGWFTWLRELGCVMKTLPGQPRCGGQSNWAMVEDLRTLFPCPSVFERITTGSTVISPKQIAHSAFNRAHCGPARLRPYRNLKDCFRQIEQAVKRTRQPSYIYAYWSELDHLGHKHGIDSTETINHLYALEQGLAQLTTRLAGSDACLLISADHGQLDCTKADQTQIAAHPALADRLRLPLCGEPRAAFCYTCADELDGFIAAAQDTLGTRFDVVRSRDLLAQGVFGPGTPHPELTHRIGDATLIARDHCVILDRLPTEKPFTPIGVHGGLSPDEMLVPLCRIDCRI
ncbi:alkaline phosphatase family protein [Thiorhodovibrio frisius]|uniref:Putative AP superfamily protein n=1 Tax=Thiorhodovibrio frisius TaxID=631362 RepID=H8Z7I2_9GAMM|nr:alkaline phosphatase family protein [Thiorhodovibrio frisius]EIC20912.1 putative AP superfamily protein [Thiorhodovibrio frisius]WPL21971.1 phosphonoacetate hydrolase [Thiorhodovibrio frisius]